VIKCILAGLASIALAVSAANADCGAARAVKVVRVKAAPVVVVEEEVIIEEEIFVPIVRVEKRIVQVQDVRTVKVQNVAVVKTVKVKK
jgi:hypothetical protein